MDDVIQGEMYPNPFAVQAASNVLTCTHFLVITLEEDGTSNLMASNQIVALGLLKTAEWKLQNSFFKNNLGDTE